MYLEKHCILFPHSPLYPSLCLSCPLGYMAFHVFYSPLEVGTAALNVAVLKVFSCSGWGTEQEAPSPNEIFPGF